MSKGTCVIGGLLTGFLLNISGWMGNNLLLKNLWDGAHVASLKNWNPGILKDIFSLLPDFVYGFGIAWMWTKLRGHYRNPYRAAVESGIFIAMVGGVTTYFVIANSGFVSWTLAGYSFLLVIVTKVMAAFYLEWAYQKHLLLKSLVTVIFSILLTMIGITIYLA